MSYPHIATKNTNTPQKRILVTLSVLGGVIKKTRLKIDHRGLSNTKEHIVYHKTETCHKTLKNAL
jgi:hypothetical protein